MIIDQSTQAIPMEINGEIIKKNKFYQETETYEVNEKVISDTIESLIDVLKRMLEWQVWDTWWIDRLVNEFINIRKSIETNLRGKYDDIVIDELLKVIDKLIQYIIEFKEYWNNKGVGNEIIRLINDLINGKAVVYVKITSKTLMINIYVNHITLRIQKHNNKNLTAQLVLTNFEHIVINVPDIFRMTMDEKEYSKFIKDILMALRLGFAVTDETVSEGRPFMGTTQLWQTLLWALLYPGKVHVYLNRINLNINSVTVMWNLWIDDSDSIKDRAFEIAENLNGESLYTFLLIAVLGDGTAFIQKNPVEANIYLVTSINKLEKWQQILNKLKVNWRPKYNRDDDTVTLRFRASNAIIIARNMLSSIPPILRDLLDSLNINKWTNIREIANMRVSHRWGEMQIEIDNIKFSVEPLKDRIRLIHRARSWAEAEEIYKRLKNKYGEYFTANIREKDKYVVIEILTSTIKRFEDIKNKVIEVLCKKLQNPKSEKQRQAIIKNLRKLIYTEENNYFCNNINY